MIRYIIYADTNVLSSLIRSLLLIRPRRKSLPIMLLLGSIHATHYISRVVVYGFLSFPILRPLKQVITLVPQNQKFHNYILVILTVFSIFKLSNLTFKILINGQTDPRTSYIFTNCRVLLRYMAHDSQIILSLFVNSLRPIREFLRKVIQLLCAGTHRDCVDIIRHGHAYCTFVSYTCRHVYRQIRRSGDFEGWTRFIIPFDQQSGNKKNPNVIH